MAVVGQPRSFHKKFLFTVEIPGVAWAGFQKCSEPKMSTAVVEQWEGGAIVADQSPGRMKTAAITLERGATKDLDLYAWYKQVNSAAAGVGLPDDQYKKTVNIVRRDRAGNVLRRIELRKAWPSEYSAGEQDNTADGNVIESLVLTYQYFEFDDDASGTPGGQPTGGTPGG
jgi:phage tail-like protein